MALLNGDEIGQSRSAYDELGAAYAAIRDLSSDINTRDAAITYQRGRISDLERNLDLTRAEKQALQGRVAELVNCEKFVVVDGVDLTEPDAVEILQSVISNGLAVNVALGVGLHRNKDAVPLLLRRIEELKQDADAAHKRASDRATQIENLEEKLDDAKNLAQTNEDNRAKIAQNYLDLQQVCDDQAMRLGRQASVLGMVDSMDFLVSRARQYLGGPNPGALTLPEIFEKLLECNLTGDEILKGYSDVLDLIPECAQHGRRCLPHCADWIKVRRQASPCDECSAKKMRDEFNLFGVNNCDQIFRVLGVKRFDIDAGLLKKLLDLADRPLTTFKGCSECEPGMELEAVRKQFGAFFREVLKMPCPIWLEDCLPAIARQVEALRVAVDRAAPPERIQPSPGVAWAKVFLDIAKSDSTKTCGECQTAKELDECFTDLKKYKAFYDAHKQFVGLWNPYMDRQVIAPGAADFGGP